jgi:hypothetical protein
MKDRENIFQNLKWKQEYTIDLNKCFKVLGNMEYENTDRRRRSKAQ